MPTSVLVSTENHILIPSAYYTLQKHIFTWTLCFCTVKKHNPMATDITALYSNTHSQVQCDKTLYRTTNLNVHYYPAFDRNTHSHAHSCLELYINTHYHAHYIIHCIQTHLHITTAYCTLQKHMITCSISTALYRNTSSYTNCYPGLNRNTHLHHHLHHCTLQIKHNHKPNWYRTLEKHIKISSVVLLYTETYILISTAFLHSTETHIHRSSARNTNVHAKC